MLLLSAGIATICHIESWCNHEQLWPALLAAIAELDSFDE